MTISDDPVVLVVEDERDLAEFYVEWLEDDYDVRAAHDGEQALDLLDDEVDVVLLDRRLPKLSGDEMLEEIHKRGLTCRVAMVTAVSPDFDIVEMGFDEYLCKPIEKETLCKTVEYLMELATYDNLLREYGALASKIGVLEAEKDESTLETSEEYAEVQAQFEDVEDQLHNAHDQFTTDDFRVLFHEPAVGE